MAFTNFQEYLDNKNKLQTSGVVQTVADYEGPNETKPPQEGTKGKGNGQPNPYLAGPSAVDPNKNMDKTGFANAGSKELIYNPDTKVPAKVGEGGTKLGGDWPKTKTQEWLDKTKGLSLVEFTKQIRKQAYNKIDECVCDISSPAEAVKYVVETASVNSSVRSSLIREMKRSGKFGKFVKEMMEHSECYVELAKLMENESVARRLVRAMNEEVGPPAHDIFKKKAKPPMDGDGPDNIHGEDSPPGDEDDLDGDEDEMDGDDHDMDDHDMDDHDMDGDDHDVDMDDSDHDMGDESGDDDMGDGHDLGGEGMGDDDGMGMPPPPPPKRKKRKAHHNLLSAMKDSGMGDSGMGGGSMGMGGM